MSSSASSTNLQKTVIGNVIGNSTALNLYPKTRADFSEVFAGTQCSAVLRQEIYQEMTCIVISMASFPVAVLQIRVSSRENSRALPAQPSMAYPGRERR